jgi:hypothetical protein
VKSRIIRSVVFIILLGICNPAFSGAIILGVNLELLEGGFGELSYDGGLGFQAGYEFKERSKWQFGALVEYFDSWNKQEDLTSAGEMTFDSYSLYATARPNNWPIMFKAGVVNADYKVLLQDYTQNFREVRDTGYGYGVALVFGDKYLRYNLLEVKRIKIGSDTFTSYGINISILSN